jgi:succinate dehydrogenase/fumarate reductase flavoprotein subunit
MEVDVVVVGSGAAGLTAAVVAAHAGLKVIVLESTPLFGGTTAFSGGGVWIPANHHLINSGTDDNFEAGEAYLKTVLGNFYDKAKIETYLRTAPEMLRYMEQNSSLLLAPSNIPDYAPGSPGWQAGRCLLTADFDGNLLGEDFDSIRPPIPEMGLFGSMQISPLDAYRMQHWRSSFGESVFTFKRMATYFLERLKGKRGRHMANGNALAGRLFKSARDAGVTLLNNSPAKELIIDGGRIGGVVAQLDGKRASIIARRGVVLASGGIGANEEMRQQLMPQSANGWSLQPEGCKGEGIAMGRVAGGVVPSDNAANGIWAPASSFTRPDGSLAKFPSLFFDRHCPGSILVDARTGKRFVDESFHYQNFGETCLDKGVTKVWMISHAPAVAKYGIGMVKPAPFSPDPWVKKGYLHRANSIAELAAKIGVDPLALGNTIAEFNGFAESGVDPDFGRGGNAYSAYMGDFTHKPNTALGALQTAPYYALEIRPSDLGSVVGLETSARAEVLDQAGTPIPGLYAAGLDANTIMRGRYPGGGSSLGPAMTYGYIAAKELAGETAA